MQTLNEASFTVWLYLDDVRSKPKDYDLHVTNAKDALKCIATGKITHISFDHDLGDKTRLTGYHVAKMIERWAFRGHIRRLTWNIHSANPVGAKRIKQAMENADRYWTEHGL